MLVKIMISIITFELSYLLNDTVGSKLLAATCFVTQTYKVIKSLI